MAGQDYYALLGVSRNASAEELKRAYRRLARELHPDANQGDPAAEEKFKEVTLAYEVLSNPETRRRYDMFGPEAIRGTGAAGGGGGSMGDAFFGAGGLGDVFEAFFGNSPFGGGSGGFGGGGRARRGPQRGADAEIRLSLDFEEAVFGAAKDVSLKVPVACATCSGSGAAQGTGPTSCGACSGTGEVRRVRQSILGQMVTASPCAQCGGTGMYIASPCVDCRGEGRVTRERTLSVEVPAGIDDGTTLRISGVGPVGLRGGPSGDVYVHLAVKPNAVFTRDGYDLVRFLNISMTQAALGTKISVESLDGEEVVDIPAGTQTGKVFRFRGKGVPHVGGRGRGDLVVSIQVETPTRLTKEQEDLLRQLAEARGEKIEPVDESLRAKLRSAFR